MIDDLIKNATLSKDKVALNAYKNIKAEFEKFKYAQIIPRKVTSDIATRIIANYAKKLEDAVKQFSEAHRDDLVSEYTNELEVVKKLLPEPVNESEICSFIESDEKYFNQFWITISNKEEETYMEMQIPKKCKKDAINYLKSIFPTTDGKIIYNSIKKYEV